MTSGRVFHGLVYSIRFNVSTLTRLAVDDGV